MRAIVNLEDDDLIVVINEAYRIAHGEGSNRLRKRHLTEAYVQWLGMSILVSIMSLITDYNFAGA